jgi:hypothetical protein
VFVATLPERLQFIFVVLYTILRRMLGWDSLSVLLSPFCDGVTSELPSHVPFALY